MSAKTSKRIIERQYATKNIPSFDRGPVGDGTVANIAARKYWVNSDPVSTAFFSALALSFPMEKQFSIAALTAIKNRLSLGARDQMKPFIFSESLRGRAYSLFNRTNIYPRFDVAPVEKIISTTIDNEMGKSPETRLLHAICMEHILVTIAQELIGKTTHFWSVDADIRELWLCHSISEIEQRSVTFNAWLDLTSGWGSTRRWLTQSLAMLVVSFVFSKNSINAMLIFLEQDGMSRPQAIAQIVKGQLNRGSFFRGVLRRWFRFLKPGFHPE